MLRGPSQVSLTRAEMETPVSPHFSLLDFNNIHPIKRLYLRSLLLRVNMIFGDLT